ncbi:MAG TPA: ABC transporter substrate-binding protein [Streptosporangiales bacterium]
MTHRLPIALAAVAVIGIAGCSSGTTPSAKEAKMPDNKNLALVLGVKGSPFYQALQCGAQAEAKKLGVSLKVSAPDQFAADSQIPVVNAVRAQNPAVAAVVPTDAQALVPPVRQLTQAGTRVITVDQTLADAKLPMSQVLTDNSHGGAMAADEMNKLLGGKGKVLVITQPPGSTAQDQRTKGFVDQLKKYKGIKYLGAQYQSDDPQKAAQIITSTLSAHPDLSGVFATNDQGAIGAVTGLKQAKATKKVKLIAYDAATAEVNALKNGTISALIAQNPTQEGQVTVQLASKLMKGQSVPKTKLTQLVTITAGENAKADKYEYRSTC